MVATLKKVATVFKSWRCVVQKSLKTVGCVFLQEFTRNFPPGAAEHFANHGRVHIVFQNNFDKISLKSP